MFFCEINSLEAIRGFCFLNIILNGMVFHWLLMLGINL
jgi:hypothetical protein